MQYLNKRMETATASKATEVSLSKVQPTIRDLKRSMNKSKWGTKSSF